ncbi:MAG: hypothetical protein IKK53_02020 [Ruminiclostridium sp.]|nr:hypothetical protein [Ruminiclostridium sp.]
MRATTQRIVSTGAGYGTIEINNHWTKSSRAPKSKKSSLRMSAVNEKNSKKAFFAFGYENFNSYDWHITFTFNHNISYQERFNLVMSFLDELKKLYAKHPRYDITDPESPINLDVLRRIVVWGIGEENEKLHAHCLANRIEGIGRNEIIELGCKLGIDIGICKIRDRYQNYGRTEEEIVGACLYYLWKHNDTLTDKHRKLIKKRYYPSHSLVKPEQLDERVSVHILVKLDKLYANNYTAFKSFVQRLFPNRIIRKARVWHSKKEPLSPPHFVCEFIEYFSLSDTVLSEYQADGKTFFLCENTGEIFSPSAVERMLQRRRDKENMLFRNFA